MKGKRQISDEDFEKWILTCEELLGTLAETAGSDEGMRYFLGTLMLWKACELTRVQPTIH